MSKLLVNAPTGDQEIITVGEGGEYFELSRVLWDERTDGPLPVITLGGMKRVGNTLELDAQLLAATNEKAVAAAAVAYKAQRAAEYPSMADYLDGIVKGDTAQVQTYIAACLAVKAKYPKP